MRYILMTSLCVLLLSLQAWGANYGEIQPASDVIALWHFNGDATDSAGSNDGTVTGATSIASGKFGGAYDFDGSADYIEIPNPGAVFDGGSITIIAWINPDDGDGSGYPRIVDRVYNGQFAFYINESSGRLGGSVATSGSDYDGSPGSTIIPVVEWSCVTMVYDGSDLTFYLNGVPDGSTSSPEGGLASSSSIIRIGMRVEGTSREFEGLIDEVAIWNRALSADEIKALYAMQQGGYGVID